MPSPASSSSTLERRKTPRTVLQNFVYLKLGDSHYGSVLNISEKGLCFHSMVPLGKIGTVNFSLSEGNHRVDGTGELVWADQVQKTGGLLFTGLSAAATRELIENWISPAEPARATSAAQPILLPTAALPQENSSQPQLEIAVRRLFRVASALSRLRLSMPLRGFSGGLFTGLLVSGLLAGLLVFHSYRRQFGELLIHWGQQFAAQTQTQALPPPAISVRSSEKEAAPPEPTTTHPSRAGKTKLHLPSKPSSSERGKPPGAEPITIKHDLRSLHLRSTPPPNGPLAMPLIAPPSWLPSSVTSIPGSGSNTPDAIMHVDRPAQVTLRTESSHKLGVVSTSEMYLDVGKFKDSLQASDILEQLARLGFPATTVQKGRLWTNAYHVLVGPYDTAQQFKTARKGLALRGFQPKPFEKGSRSFTLLSGLMLDGVQVPSGDYIISWESYVSEATVKFVRDHSVVTTVDGKWMKRGERYKLDAYTYRPNRDGSKTLLEIRFRDMSKALVFGKYE
jgi:PilZ domain/SPOR domain